MSTYIILGCQISECLQQRTHRRGCKHVNMLHYFTPTPIYLSLNALFYPQTHIFGQIHYSTPRPMYLSPKHYFTPRPIYLPPKQYFTPIHMYFSLNTFFTTGTIVLGKCSNLPPDLYLFCHRIILPPDLYIFR